MLVTSVKSKAKRFQNLEDNCKLVHRSTQLIEILVDDISLFHDSTFVSGGLQY